ncbi:MAG: IS1380 family transposase [Actinobacteria bacterium]|nr:IS1380 family transposase [Actinomycetota bacterium]
MQRDGRSFTVEVTADGEGLVSHAGSALLAQVADKTGLTRALSQELEPLRKRRSGHAPGRVVADLAVMLADGGDCLADLRAVRDQAPLFGEVASDSTAFRVIDAVASDPQGIESLRVAHARARARAWKLAGAPKRLTIDLDATLIGAHSDKEGAAGTFKGGYGFHPMLAYGDETGEALAAELRPGNAGANTAGDQIAVAEAALEQIPSEHIETIELLVRVDSAGATHELLDWCREGRIGFSVGFDLTESVRAAICDLPEDRWIAALDQDDSERRNGQVAELTDRLDLTGWPERSRVIVRRERPHPGAQLSFTDVDGHRFQAILTDQPDQDVAAIERRHRARARVEDHIRNDKDTGLANLPFRDFEHNRAWLALALMAHDLIAWTKALLLTGELARAEPKRLRYRLLHVAGRLAFHARAAVLRLQASWPWATDLAAAFARLKALPGPAG